MKRNRSLVIGLLCGLCCMVCVGLYTSSVEASAQAASAESLERYGGDQIEVCVAKRDIAAGEVIDESCVETKTWIAALVPEGAVASSEEAVGQQVGSSIFKGEVVTSRRFDEATTPIDVPDGMTAVSVPAKDVQAVGGALATGMRADVYAIGSTSTVKLATQALIVATSVGDSSSSSISWVTLAVPPSSVEELVSAAQNLELYFVLPASSDAAEPNATDTSEADSIEAVVERS